MADARDIIVNALIAAGAAGLPLFGGHHADDADTWDERTYDAAFYSVEGGALRYEPSSEGGRRLQMRQYMVLVQLLIRIDPSEPVSVARQWLADHRVALEKALLPSKIGVPIGDIMLRGDTRPVLADAKNGGGTVALCGLMFDVTAFTMEGAPDVLLDPKNPATVEVDFFE